jgi:hypothetical protein
MARIAPYGSRAWESRMGVEGTGIAGSCRITLR